MAKPDKREKYQVMEVFGIPFEVSSPRLAELLTADAKSVLSTEIGEITKVFDATSEGVDPASIGTEERFKTTIETIGCDLGFDVSWSGLWKSRTGITMAIRVVDRVPSIEQARRSVGSTAEQLDKVRGETAGLFVVADQVSAEILKIAIQSKGHFDRMRVITASGLYRLHGVVEGRLITHEQIVALLVPLASIDVSALLSLLDLPAKGVD